MDWDVSLSVVGVELETDDAVGWLFLVCAPLASALDVGFSWGRIFCDALAVAPTRDVTWVGLGRLALACAFVETDPAETVFAETAFGLTNFAASDFFKAALAAAGRFTNTFFADASTVFLTIAFCAGFFTGAFWAGAFLIGGFLADGFLAAVFRADFFAVVFGGAARVFFFGAVRTGVGRFPGFFAEGITRLRCCQSRLGQ